MLRKFNMVDCKPVSTPADPNVKLNAEMYSKNNEEIEHMKRIPYFEATGNYYMETKSQGRIYHLR